MSASLLGVWGKREEGKSGREKKGQSRAGERRGISGTGGLIGLVSLIGRGSDFGIRRRRISDRWTTVAVERVARHLADIWCASGIYKLGSKFTTA